MATCLICGGVWPPLSKVSGRHEAGFLACVVIDFLGIRNRLFFICFICSLLLITKTGGFISDNARIRSDVFDRYVFFSIQD